MHEGCSCLRLLYVLCPVRCCACFYSKIGEMNLASQAGPSIFPCAEILQPLGPRMGQVSLQKVERTLPSLDHAPVICSLEGCTSSNLWEDSQYLSEGFRERERANLVFSSRIGVWFSINTSQRLTFPWVVVLHSHFWSLRDSLTLRVSIKGLLCVRPICNYFRYSSFLLASHTATGSQVGLMCVSLSLHPKS